MSRKYIFKEFEEKGPTYKTYSLADDTGSNGGGNHNPSNMENFNQILSWLQSYSRAGLNHALHTMDGPDDPPGKKYKFPRTKVSFKVDQGAALFIEEDNKRFFDVDIYTVKGTIVLDEGVLTISTVGTTTTTQVNPYFFGTATVTGSSAYGLSSFSVSLPIYRDYGYTALQSGYQQIGSTTYTLPKGTTNVNVSIKAGYIFNIPGKGVGTPFPPTTSYNYHFGNGPSINQYPLFK
ncbi:hypothetical protein [Amniculibacterium sp. G2-70]|uniref:hypothetical protein n=1 Tax=Amniculibacterium sp. G2-70 TaxID=2767188 RepID=UPI0016544CE5|nr:hypothetical protein [Amniculibacterium sp. G2-70]